MLYPGGAIISMNNVGQCWVYATVENQESGEKEGRVITKMAR